MYPSCDGFVTGFATEGCVSRDGQAYKLTGMETKRQMRHSRHSRAVGLGSGEEDVYLKWG